MGGDREMSLAHHFRAICQGVYSVSCAKPGDDRTHPDQWPAQWPASCRPASQSCRPAKNQTMRSGARRPGLASDLG